MRTEHKLFVVLTTIFVSCLLLGDILGGKTISTFSIAGHDLGPISVGIIPFPVTFLLTDVINDFYGRKGARFLTLVGFGMAVLAYALLQLTTALPVDPSTYFTQPEFSKIFGGSAQLFIASMIAYLIGQFLDIQVFQFWKALTQSKHLWLRATGSTMHTSRRPSSNSASGVTIVPPPVARPFPTAMRKNGISREKPGPETRATVGGSFAAIWRTPLSA